MIGCSLHYSKFVCTKVEILTNMSFYSIPILETKCTILSIVVDIIIYKVFVRKCEQILVLFVILKLSVY